MRASAKRSRAWRALAILAAGLLLAGCASVRPLDLSADPPTLEKKEGILAVHITTDVALESVDTSAGTVARDVPPGDHVYFVAATAGSYRWTRFIRSAHFYRYLYRLDTRDERLGFDVEAGSINYPGTLVVKRLPSRSADGFVIRGNQWLGIRTANRSAQAFRALERQHPCWLDAFPLRYAGSSRDEFLARYLELRRRRSVTSDASDPAP